MNSVAGLADHAGPGLQLGELLLGRLDAFGIVLGLRVHQGLEGLDLPHVEKLRVRGGEEGAPAVGHLGQDLALALHLLRIAEAAVLHEEVEDRSEERRGGKEWGSTCRSRGSPYHKKKK